MLESIPQEAFAFGAGALGGGILQIASEIFKLGGNFVDMAKGFAAARDESYRETLKEESREAEKAAKRNPVGLRASIAILVIAVTFLGVFLYGALNGGITSIVTEKEPWLNAFGLFKLGGGLAVETAKGLVLPPWFGTGTMLILGAIFGIQGVKSR